MLGAAVCNRIYGQGHVRLIIVVRFVSGVGSFRESERTVAEVGPYKISTDYQEEYNRILKMYRTIYRENLTEICSRTQPERKGNERDSRQIFILIRFKAKRLGMIG